MSLYSCIFMVVKKFRAKHIVFIKILTRLVEVFYSRSEEDGRAISQKESDLRSRIRPLEKATQARVTASDAIGFR